MSKGNSNNRREMTPWQKIVAIIAVLVSVAFGGNAYYQSSQPSDIPAAVQTVTEQTETQNVKFVFRNQKLLNQHYEKHGKEMGFSSAKAYEKAASAVAENKSSLHKTEAEDGDDVYYLERTNEFVIVSTDGYLRTYYKPNGGKKYFDRQ